MWRLCALVFVLAGCALGDNHGGGKGDGHDRPDMPDRPDKPEKPEHGDEDYWQWEPPVPCKVVNTTSNVNTVLRRSPCVNDFLCNVGPVSTRAGRSTLAITFCAKPGLFSLYQACEVSMLNGTQVKTQKCGFRSECRLGPFTISSNGSDFSAYFCGNTIDITQEAIDKDGPAMRACRLENKEGRDLHVRNCPPGYRCKDGPYNRTFMEESTRHFFCKKYVPEPEYTLWEVVHYLMGTERIPALGLLKAMQVCAMKYGEIKPKCVRGMVLEHKKQMEAENRRRLEDAWPFDLEDVLKVLSHFLLGDEGMRGDGQGMGGAMMGHGDGMGMGMGGMDGSHGGKGGDMGGKGAGKGKGGAMNEVFEVFHYLQHVALVEAGLFNPKEDGESGEKPGKGGKGDSEMGDGHLEDLLRFVLEASRSKGGKGGDRGDRGDGREGKGKGKGGKGEGMEEGGPLSKVMEYLRREREDRKAEDDKTMKMLMPFMLYRMGQADGEGQCKEEPEMKMLRHLHQLMGGEGPGMGGKGGGKGAGDEEDEDPMMKKLIMMMTVMKKMKEGEDKPAKGKGDHEGEDMEMMKKLMMMMKVMKEMKEGEDDDDDEGDDMEKMKKLMMMMKVMKEMKEGEEDDDDEGDDMEKMLRHMMLLKELMGDHEEDEKPAKGDGMEGMLKHLMTLMRVLGGGEGGKGKGGPRGGEDLLAQLLKMVLKKKQEEEHDKEEPGLDEFMKKMWLKAAKKHASN